MATILPDISRTLDEFLLIPSLTTEEHNPDNISLSTGITKHKVGEPSELSITAPMVSAAMQSVSNHTMAIALAKCGGISFIYCSQAIEAQAKMIRQVKSFKSGFVVSDSNLKPTNTLEDAINLTKVTGHSTIAITDNGEHDGKLLGIITDKDFRITRVDVSSKVSEYMTPFENLVYGVEPLTLQDANNIIWDNKVNCIPVVDDEKRLKYFVFRKDYELSKHNTDAVVDKNKSYLVGAAVNTRDYEERIPALVEAGVDILCIDSSDGYSKWQSNVIEFVRKTYGNTVKIGAGNVVSPEGFRYLADAGADFIKIGIGGGSICITREQKGIGRGQASALIDVARARDEYANKHGVYIPLCSDGGIVNDYHITVSLALGADFVMMGRYFARFDEGPTKTRKIGTSFVKEYWGEGSNRAKNWERYDIGGKNDLSFEEGVDSYVAYAGSLKENLEKTLYKIKSTFCNCGVKNIEEFQKNAVLTLVSELSIREGKAHDVMLKERD